MFKELAKKIIPNKVKAYIKMGTEREYFANVISMIEKTDDEFDLLLGSAIHTNLGDHLITLAEQQLFEEINPERKIFEIPTEVFQYYRYRLEQAVKPTTRIFINGGGWMGNLWPNEEKLLQDMVDVFNKNKIVIFPQTVYYDKNVAPYQELIDRGNQIYKQCQDLTLFVRDRQSFDFSKGNLAIEKIVLVPDIALYYSFEHKNCKNNVIGLCVREDREKSSNSGEIERVCEALSSMGFIIERLSTMFDKRVPSNMRKEVVEARLNDFSKCCAIITDRLHGMIFSYIAGTPCIAFDNRTKKVSGVYEEWLSKCKGIYPCFSETDIDINEIVEFVQETLGEDGCILNLQNSFESVKQEVKYG